MRLPLPIILILIPVLLLVIFGHNPIKEAELQWRKYGDDPLVAAINIHNEKMDQQAQGGVWGMGGALKPPAPADNQPAPGLIPGMDDTPSEFAEPTVTAAPSNTNAAPAIAVPAQPQAPAPGGYYPPLVQNTAPAAAQATTTPPEGGPRLRSGQPIGFSGMEVFSVDATGKRTPLPDGSYTLYDGSPLTVQGGKRVAPN